MFLFGEKVDRKVLGEKSQFEKIECALNTLVYTSILEKRQIFIHNGSETRLKIPIR